MKDRKKNVKSSYFKDMIERFCRHKLAVVGLVIILVEIFLLIVLPVILNLDPYKVNSAFGAIPSKEFWLGTDTTGRDLFARLIYGGRTSLVVGLCSVTISAVIGIPLGMLAGYYRGVVETIIMRLSDIFLSVPSMILILVLVSVIGPSLTSVILIIGVMGWPSFGRLLYANVISIREKDYVESARAIGTKDGAIMLRYILPNAISPVLVQFTFGVAGAILSESALSFLGMGVQTPLSSWGNMLNAAQSVAIIATRWWMWVPPGVCLLITILSINLFGDGLRDALDPKAKIG